MTNIPLFSFYINEPAHAKRYKMVKFFEFYFLFLHKTEEKYHRIYFLVFLLPKFEENLINDVIKCCHYNDTFYYVIWSYIETKCDEIRYYVIGWELPRPTLYHS